MLEESESDLDDDPFSTNTTPAVSATPKGLALIKTTAADDDSILSLSDAGSVSFSDDEDPFVELLAKKNPVKPAQKPSRITTRSLRSSTVKPKPVVVNETPAKRTPVPKAKKPLFSLDSLLKEKTRREKAGYDIETAKAQMALDDSVRES